MVSLEELASLDLQLWLRSGEEAANRLHCAQSTISRRNIETLRRFNISMKRSDGEWRLFGNKAFLNLERQIHQLHRLTHQSQPLRLEANFWATPVLASPAPAHWMLGVGDHVGMERPLQLVRERIIDAWIGSYQPDLPNNDSELAIIDLCSTPVYLVANKNHPLAGKKQLTIEDLEKFPSLSIPGKIFPKTEKILKRHQLWSNPARMQRYKPSAWQGQTEDQVTLCYGTCLALEVMPELTILDYDLELVSGESLVVRRDLLSQPMIKELLAILKKRVQQKAKQHGQRLTPLV